MLCNRTTFHEVIDQQIRTKPAQYPLDQIGHKINK